MSAHNPAFNEEHIPLAYLITFRCYGTWLHGDARGSTDRHQNKYDTTFIAPDRNWQRYSAFKLKHPPVKLDATMRAIVETALVETCEVRGWLLRAHNVRTNHVHAVVTAGCHAKFILNALKANATRHLRNAAYWNVTHSPWADKGSNRYLWTERSIDLALDYVLNHQGDDLADFQEA